MVFYGWGYVMGKSDKKDKLLDSSQALMMGQGYVATTIDEICENAGVTKGSFFYYFKDKEALGKEVAQRFAKQGQMALFANLSEPSQDPLKKIYDFLDGAIECSKNSDKKGCLLGIFAQELSETHPEIRKICEASFNGFIENFERVLTEAKSKYAPKAKFKAGDLAEYFLALAQGSMIIARARKDAGVMERALVQFKDHLKGLYKK